MEGADHFLVAEQNLDPAQDAQAQRGHAFLTQACASLGISILAAKSQANHCPGPTNKENNTWT